MLEFSGFFIVNFVQTFASSVVKLIFEMASNYLSCLGTLQTFIFGLIETYMAAQVLWIAGSIICIGLGTLHLLFTFFTDKFSSRNEQVIAGMKTSFPKITTRTTLWKSWMGFNASHSLGAIFIGVVNVYFAGWHYAILLQGPFLQFLSLCTVSFYLWLAWKYWYRLPFIGILATLVCYLMAILLINL